MRRHERGQDPGHELLKTIEIRNRDGQVVERKEVVTAKGLLHLAHNERLSKISTRLIQSPTKENGETAIVLVFVATSRGSFTGLGDANPRNVNARIAPHFIRMAETRALARALRAALDVGAVAIEELEEEFSFAEPRDERPRGETRDAPRGAEPRVTPRPDPRPLAPPTEARRPNGHGSPDALGTSPRNNGDGYDRSGGGPDAPMSDAQKRMLYRVAFEQGHEGDNARAWLQSEFEVDSLAKVDKRQASRFIDHYKSKASNGHDPQNGHAGAAE